MVQSEIQLIERQHLLCSLERLARPVGVTLFVAGLQTSIHRIVESNVYPNHGGNDRVLLVCFERRGGEKFAFRVTVEDVDQFRLLKAGVGGIRKGQIG